MQVETASIGVDGCQRYAESLGLFLDGQLGFLPAEQHRPLFIVDRTPKPLAPSLRSDLDRVSDNSDACMGRSDNAVSWEEVNSILARV